MFLKKFDIAAKRRKNRKNIKERKEQISRKKAQNTQKALLATDPKTPTKHGGD